MLTKARIQQLRSLQDKKHRESLGLFAVEGGKVVGELLASGYAVEELYATAAWTAPAGPLPPVTRIADEEMARISHFPTPSPVLAVCSVRRDPLPPGALDRGLTLALDGVQDAGNVGSLLRIADWFGLDRVLLSPDCADPFSPKVIHASMGSFARVALHAVPLAEALAGIRVPILGCDLAGDSIHALAPLPDAVVVIGSEGRGLSPAVRARVTRTITIPRRGGAESLNAAVAGGIVCAALRRS